MNGVSIIISYSGKLKLLAKSLDSLKSQIKVGDEIILVNDSSDNIQDFIGAADYIDYINLKNVDKNVNNMVLARNRGSMRASNDILVFIDEDMLAECNLIDMYRESIPQFNLVCGGIRWIKDNNDIDSDYRLGKLPSDASNTIVKANMLADFGMGGGGNFGIVKRIFYVVGSFDVEYNGAWGNEDIDLYRRVMQAGYDVHYCYRALAYHQYHERNLKGFEKNKDVLKRKWTDPEFV